MCASVLVLGDANLSFSAALTCIVKDASGIVATTFEEQAELQVSSK